MINVLQPPGWSRPKGYANGISAEGTLVFTAGVVGWNEKQVFEAESFIDQFRQTLLNTVAILSEAGAEPEDVVRMTCYVTSKSEYVQSVEQIGVIWREVMGKVYPCMAVIEVVGLVEDLAKVEIETTAVIDRNHKRSRL